jgi:hypothetical protein
MTEELLRQAVAAAKQGQRREAIQLTRQHIKANPSDERGWYALARLVDDNTTKIKALEKVLALNPNHSKAQAMLDELQPSFFSSDLFDEDDEPDPELFTSQTYKNEQDSSFDGNPFEPEPAPNQRRKTATTADEPSPAIAKQGGSTLEFVLGLGIFLLAIAGIAGLGYYAYFEQHRGLFGLLGPDLNTTVAANGIEVRHPDDWENSTTDGIIVAQNFEATTAAACPEFLGDVLLSLLSGIGTSPESRVGYDPDESNFYMTLIPLSPQTLAQFNNCSAFAGIQSGEGYVEMMVDNAQVASDSGSGAEIRSEADLEDTTIADQDGVFGYVTIYLRSGTQDIEFAYGNYAAAFERNGQEYLFIMTSFGAGADSQQRLVKRILRTIAFQG